ncbi:2390_t:CDS:2 [Entrophospora sp. SA101]|nr:2390_t:CDS:2 [Entrophospora sp. SA101]
MTAKKMMSQLQILANEGTIQAENIPKVETRDPTSPENIKEGEELSSK